MTVVSPHRGDAALALGLSVEAWLAEGHAVTIVNAFTRSEFAPYSDVGSVHENDRMSFASAVRKREDESWAKLYRGKLTLIDLNLKDAPLRLHCGADEAFGLQVNASEKAFVKIQKAVAASRADALVLPLGLGGHIDHVTAREAGLAGRAEWQPIAFYEELPEALALRAAGQLEHLLGELATTMRMKLEPVFVGDARSGEALAAGVARRRKVAWCYDSQMDEEETAAVSEYVVAYEGCERLWANEVWA
jgi:hypothetical protein